MTELPHGRVFQASFFFGRRNLMSISSISQFSLSRFKSVFLKEIEGFLAI